jgi:hypothetical protein
MQVRCQRSSDTATPRGAGCWSVDMGIFVPRSDIAAFEMPQPGIA